MSQYNNGYRLFFKKLTNIEGKSITSSQLRVKNYDLNRDLLTKATSKFEVLEVSDAIENGDIVGMYDSFGTIVYLGVITYIENNTIQAGQMTDIFDDNWLYNDPRLSTLEATVKRILQNDFQNNSDTLLASIFDCFTINTISSTNRVLETQEEHYVVNFANFLYSLYEKYSIIVDFEITFNEGTPIINIGRPTFNKLLIGNNSAIFRNFNITTNVFQTNKLIIYSSEGVYRRTYYATTSGIVTNPSALNRLQKINTNIVFSDDDFSILEASSLRNQIYNHEITLELVLKNNLLPFSDLHLGQEAEIYFNGDYYDSVLTGYSLQGSDGNNPSTIMLTFGLVRTALSTKLFKRFKT